MLLSRFANFIYIKTNKTASTSVEMALQPFCQIDPSVPIEEKTHTVVSEAGIIGQRLIPKSQAKYLDLIWYNHMSATEIKEKIGAEIWENCHKIHTVRNPFDKVLSSFFWQSSLRGLTYDTLAEAITAFESYVLKRAWNTDYDILHIDDQYVGTMQVRYEKSELRLTENRNRSQLRCAFSEPSTHEKNRKYEDGACYPILLHTAFHRLCFRSL